MITSTSSSDDSLKQLLRRLWAHINIRRRRQLCLLSVLMVVSSFSEVLSIGAVFPFLAVLTSPQFVYDHLLAKPFLILFNISSADQLLLPITILFIMGVLIASALRMSLLWATTRLSFAMGRLTHEFYYF